MTRENEETLYVLGVGAAAFGAQYAADALLRPILFK